MKPEITSEEYWDRAHKSNSSPRLGGTESQAYYDYFGKVGPFREDVLAAKSIIDIGPGMCKFLEAHPSKERHGTDISSISRKRMEGIGVKAYAPGYVPSGVADLATCLSVIQHCTSEEVKVILSDISKALKPRGIFYANGVNTGLDNSGSHAVLRRRARFSHNLEFIKESCEDIGLIITNEYTHRAPMQVWIIRGIKA